MDRKIRLITNCERPVNYLMRIAIRQWLKTFDPSEIIFLVNNITDFDLVKDLKNNFNIEAKKVSSIEEASSSDGCLVWEYLKCSDYWKYHELDRDIVNDLQSRLLFNGVDVVIFLDRDEILYHENLRYTLNTFEELTIRPRGIEIIQHGEELDLDEDKPLNQQRSYIRYFPSKSKPCITRQSIKWQTGRHLTMCGKFPHGDEAGSEAEYPGLYLIHIDKIDMNLLYQLGVEADSIFSGYIKEKASPISFSEWFTESHRNGELYKDEDFLLKVGI